VSEGRPSDDLLPVRYGSRMLRRFGWFYRILGLRGALSSVRFEDHSAERIRAAQSKGPIVYVLLHRSAIDHLALNTVLNRRRLPLSVWANGMTSFYWQPVAEAWRELGQRWSAFLRSGRAPAPVESGWLKRILANGQPVTLFVRDGITAPPPRERDPFQAVLDAQEASDRPIQLVPVVCVWDPAPERPDSNVQEFFLGSRENPGALSRLSNLYLQAGQGPFVQVGEPADLGEFVRRVPEEHRLESLRALLRRYLRRESGVVRGPRLIGRAAMKRAVLDNPPMRQFAEEEAARTGQTPSSVQTAMSKEFDKIAANFSWTFIRFLSVSMKPLWNRVYDGYHIPEEDLDRLRNASRDGTAVLVPCHKSHFDYLLLSWVLYHSDLIVPYVIAGINLAIWPVHYALRAAGGFFIRRSFSGEPIHPVVFNRYLREMLRQGYTVEFFIEGGRTRTGKLLRPRLGVLEMILDADPLMPPGREITLLPVAIAYEQVAEEGAYRSELRGAEKQKETFGQLLAARTVLRRRFGKVHLRIGEPIKASDAIEGLDWEQLPDAERRPQLQRVGDQLVHRIGAVMVILPTSLVALATLAHHRQAITHTELLDRVRRIHEFLRRAGAPGSPSLERFEQAMHQALDRFAREGLIRQLQAGGERVWHIVPDARETLEFHKNQVLHFFAPAAMVAASTRALPSGPIDRDALLARFVELRGILVREFTFDPDHTDATLFAAGIADLVAFGAMTDDDGDLAIADADRMGEIHGLLRSLLEAYRLVAAECQRLDDATGDVNAFVRSLRDDGDTWLASGMLTRPEALSAVSIRNAVLAAADLGLAERDGKLVKPDIEGLHALAATLAPTVDV
jgi:glycerol-3-phosphate O-acyltransferase